jgi:predicted dehydrogenase
MAAEASRRPLRVGIVGAGFGGSVHAPAFALHPRFEPVAIASPNSAAQIAAEREIPHAFPSVEAMLAGVELDLVSVASPPFDHHRSVMAALAAGKHVLCEKPFALTLAQAEEMHDASLRAGNVAALCFEFRYLPGVRALLEAVRELEAPRTIEIVRMGSDLLERRTNRPHSWWFERAKGGGVANAFMPHFFDFANQLAGRTPRATHGLLRTANPRRTGPHGTFTSTVADGAFAFVDYGDGLVARVSNDSTTVVDSTTLAVHGETRSAVASGTTLFELNLYLLAEEEQDERDLPQLPYEQYGGAHSNLPAFLALLDALAAAIDDGTPGVPTFADGLVVQRQLEAIGYGR